MRVAMMRFKRRWACTVCGRRYLYNVCSTCYFSHFFRVYQNMDQVSGLLALRGDGAWLAAC